MKPRVPIALQEVFLQSNAGEDVQAIQAPKNGLGFKIFHRKDRKVSVKPILGMEFSSSSSPSSSSSLIPDARNPAPSKDSKMKPMKTTTTTTTSTTTMKRNVHDIPQRTPRNETAAESYRKSNPIPESKNQGVRQRKPTDTPQGFLEAALQDRGYSTEKYVTIDCGYYCRPTPLQKASYGTRMNHAIAHSDATLLRRMLDVGLSPNPCNDFGESLVHRICRRGDHKLLRVLLEKDCRLQVADDYGRTPLHDAFWKADPSPEVLDLILLADKDLIRMMDCRGFVPLDYVRKEAHPDVIQYLSKIVDKFFPPRHMVSADVDTGIVMDMAPPLTKHQPHTIPVPDPRQALEPHTASLVANGEIEPEDAIDWDCDSSASYDSDYYSSDDGSYCSNTDVHGHDDLDLEFDDAEILEFCRRVGGPLPISKHCQAIKSPITSRSFIRENPLKMHSNPDLTKLVGSPDLS